MQEIFDYPLPMTAQADEAAANAKSAEDWFILWHLKAAMYLFPFCYNPMMYLTYWACWREAKDRNLLPDWREWSRQMAAEPL